MPTTTAPRVTELADFIGGFVAAEGCFTTTSPRRFAFRVSLGATDTASCELLRTFFGVGSVWRYPRRKPHDDDEIVFAVGALPDLVNVIVPFMEQHLPPSHKRNQYLAWWAELFDYWEHRARRPAGRR